MALSRAPGAVMRTSGDDVNTIEVVSEVSNERAVQIGIRGDVRREVLRLKSEDNRSGGHDFRHCRERARMARGVMGTTRLVLRPSATAV